MIRFVITLKNIPAKLTPPPNIHITLFSTKNNSKRNSMNKTTITYEQYATFQSIKKHTCKP